MWTPWMDKFLLTITNLSVFLPVIFSTCWGDIWPLLLSGILSLIHHSTEVRYYTPALLSSTSWQRKWFLLGDQIGAVHALLFVGKFVLLKRELPLVLLAFGFMLLSEVVMYTFPESLAIKLRTLLHVFWHILALGYLPFLSVTRYKNSPTFYQSLCTRKWE